jgi:hypothetical protein
MASHSRGSVRCTLEHGRVRLNLLEVKVRVIVDDHARVAKRVASERSERRLWVSPRLVKLLASSCSRDDVHGCLRAS